MCTKSVSVNVNVTFGPVFDLSKFSGTMPSISEVVSEAQVCKLLALVEPGHEVVAWLLVYDNPPPDPDEALEVYRGRGHITDPDEAF